MWGVGLRDPPNLSGQTVHLGLCLLDWAFSSSPHLEGFTSAYWGLSWGGGGVAEKFERWGQNEGSLEKAWVGPLSKSKHFIYFVDERMKYQEKRN